MRCWVFVMLVVGNCLSSGLGMTPYGAGGRGSRTETDHTGSGSAPTSAPTPSPRGSVPSLLGTGTQTGNTLDSASPGSFSQFQTARRPASSSGGSFAASGDTGFQDTGRPAGSSDGSFAAARDSGFQSASRPAGSSGGSFAASGDSGFQRTSRPAGSSGGSFAASGDSGFQRTSRPAGSSGGSFAASGDTVFQGADRRAGSSGGFFAASGNNVFPSFSEPIAQEVPFLGTSFTKSVIQEQPTLTVTRTVTLDAFTTLTDTIFNTFAVTLTQFTVHTTTRPLNQVVATPVDDYYTISTTVIQHPAFVTVTETKSDFRLFVRTSVTHVTLTHTSYSITHVPFTITATETVQITSPMVKTVISTHRQVVTDYRTIVNTVYVHGGYL